MPILIIKHDNLYGYGKILTADHESWSKIRTISYIRNNLLMAKTSRERRDEQDFSTRISHQEEEKENNVLRKLSLTHRKRE